MKRVAVLGSTGSIGTQTLDIISQHPEHLQAVALVAGSNADQLLAQAGTTGARRIALHDVSAANKSRIPGGMDAIVEIATDPEVDIVVVAVSGVIGLLPTIAAIRAGKAIALGSKEVLVAAGEVVMPLVREHGVTMTPIDSEHSAIFQCLQGSPTGSISELILTGSGGPFRGRKREDLAHVSVEEALDHPTWRMGGKITVDSATLMNKGLETIEAKWLFGLDIDEVSVVIHPQSIVHSMVRFRDGSVLGQMGWPDMRLPIQYALLYPERVANTLKPWDPVASGTLTFQPVNHETFPSIGLAVESSRIGGTMPCVMNAANEEAANGFLRGETSFLGISRVVEGVMARHNAVEASLESLIETDRWARDIARELC